ncbi:Carbonic anhydrase [Neonectria ditissima]|uniref:Carbonic anhydrase n=1 Tax=Neonectria ditissima TaxID=78410 RepID=A0A0P7BMI5_9HYPO|nr:Carbonic anhydrase [Neonectria ditissima]
MIFTRLPSSSASSLLPFASFSSTRSLSSALCFKPTATQIRLLPPSPSLSARFRTGFPRHGGSSPHKSSRPAPISVSTWRAMAEEDIAKYLKQSHDRLFENNRVWAEDKKKKNPDFFSHLSEGQKPEYLWIGCSDSRIPAEQITGLEPGEAFIHRNIANLVCNTDLNAMGVINYAVQHLGVKHIIVCGHYGCGGVKAAMTPKDLGLLNPWLRNIRDVYRLHEKELDSIADKEARYNRLVELNVEEQCRNVIKSADVQQSYSKNKYPIVHGWVFGFKDGLLKDLKIDFEAVLHDIQKIYNLVD